MSEKGGDENETYVQRRCCMNTSAQSNDYRGSGRERQRDQVMEREREIKERQRSEGKQECHTVPDINPPTDVEL